MKPLTQNAPTTERFFQTIEEICVMIYEYQAGNAEHHRTQILTKNSNMMFLCANCHGGEISLIKLCEEMMKHGYTYHETNINCTGRSRRNDGPCTSQYQLKIGLRYQKGQRPKRLHKTIPINAADTLRDIQKLLEETKTHKALK